MVKVMKKRVIAVLLAIFTIATLICVPAVADEGAEPENPKLTPSFEWYTKNPDANTFYISSAEEFLGLCELTWDETHRTVKKLGIDPVDFEGKTVELTADINLNPGWEWSVKIDEKGKVICVDAPANVCHGMDAFHGTLDGCGHTVSGLYFNRALGSWGHVGFIYQVKKFCNIKNIAFTNGVIYTDTAKVTTGSGGKGMGALIGAVNDVGATCKIENLYFGLDVLHMRRSDYKGGGISMVGGLIGRIEKAKTPDNANGYYPVEIDSTAVAGKIIAVNENMTSINTKAFRNSPSLHHCQVFGIIDRDYRSDYEIEKYKNDGIYALKVAEVENLFLVEDLIRLIADHLGQSPNESFAKIKEYVIHTRFAHQIDRQICQSVVAHLKYQLTAIELSKKDDDEAKNSLNTALQNIDYEKTKAEEESKFRGALCEDDYAKVLSVFNEKGLTSSIGHFLGLVDKEYCKSILALLNGKMRNEISDAISTYLPPEIPR